VRLSLIVSAPQDDQRLNSTADRMTEIPRNTALAQGGRVGSDALAFSSSPSRSSSLASEAFPAPTIEGEGILSAVRRNGRRQASTMADPTTSDITASNMSPIM
jgi:hypothetical protein